MDFSELTQIQLSSATEIKPFECVEDDLTEFLFTGRRENGGGTWRIAPFRPGQGMTAS